MGTRDRLLDSTAELFRRQGYAGTGMKQITAAAGVPWGSMYHFFPGGKAHLAMETLAHAAGAYGDILREAFRRKPEPREAIQSIFRYEILILGRSDYADGCPIAGVALDVSANDEEIRKACAAAFQSWQSVISAELRSLEVPGTIAEEIAMLVLTTLEGAILLSRTHRSPQPLEVAARGVGFAVEALLGKA